MRKNNLFVLVIVLLLLGCHSVKRSIKLKDISPELNGTYVTFKDTNVSIFVKKKYFLERITEIEDKNFRKAVKNYIREHKIIFLPESNISAKSKEIEFLFNWLNEEILKGNVGMLYDNQGDTIAVKRIEYYRIRGDLGSIQSYYKYKNLIFLRKLHSLGE